MKGKTYTRRSSTRKKEGRKACVLWCSGSVNTPELLVVALHQALFIVPNFAFHHIHYFYFPKRTMGNG